MCDHLKVLLNKSRYHLNRHRAWFVEHAQSASVNRWPPTTTWWKHYLASTNCWRMGSRSTFKTTVMVVRGCAELTLWLAIWVKHGHQRPVRRQRNRNGNDIRFFWFGVVLYGWSPRPVILHRFVRVRKFVEFIHKSLTLYLT